MDQDCYEILGVPRDAKPEDIKAAYRALALRRHPDLNAGDPRAAEVFMRLQAAYETLGNPYLRARYDLARSLKRRETTTAPRTPAPSGRPARLLMLIGALLSLRGFTGIFLDAQDAFVPAWLLAPDELGRNLRHYVTGTALILCGAGLQRLRR